MAATVGRQFCGASLRMDEDDQRLPYSLSRTGDLSASGLASPSFPIWEELDVPSIVTIDCSNGALNDLRSLARFENLQSLAADSNAIVSCDALPVMPSVQVLSLNKNQIVSLGAFLEQAVDKFPALRHLSLMGNPCCPSEIFGASQADCDRYVEQVSSALPTLETLDSTRISREAAPTAPAPIVVKVSAEMLMVRFNEMMDGWHAAQQRGDNTRPMTYLKVKSTLVAEFGADAFRLKKDVINSQMRRAPSKPSVGDATLVSSPRGSRVGSPTASPNGTLSPHGAYHTPETAADPQLRLADSGEVLQVKITKPNNTSLGFKVIGGSDRGYGGLFVLSVTSSSAGELREGDRLLAINGTGLLSSTQSEAERILNRVPRSCQVTVLRPSSGDWKELLGTFGTMPTSTYTRECRRIATAPLVKRSTIMYLGTAQLKGECSMLSAGDLFTCTLAKQPGKGVGIKMGGSLEIGGIFVTEVALNSSAAQDERIQPGCRVLEVGVRSVLYATQMEAAHLIRTSTATEVSIVFQQVSASQWRNLKIRAAADKGSTLVAKANTAREKGDVMTARRLYDDALQMPDLDPALQCQALSGLGMLSKKDCWSQAVEFHQKEAVLCSELGYIEVSARALNFVGNAYRDGMQWDRAIETYEREVDVSRSVNDQVGLARAFTSLGIVHGNQHNLQRAVECHSRALSAANNTQDRAAAARSHGNLGVSYFALKEYDQASKHHTSRLRIAEGLGDKTGQYRALANLVKVAAAQGNQVDGRKWWKQQNALAAEMRSAQAANQRRTATVGQTPSTPGALTATETPTKSVVPLRVFSPPTPPVTSESAGPGPAMPSTRLSFSGADSVISAPQTPLNTPGESTNSDVGRALRGVDKTVASVVHPAQPRDCGLDEEAAPQSSALQSVESEHNVAAVEPTAGSTPAAGGYQLNAATSLEDFM